AVNMITKPIIASNAEKTFNEAMKEVLPNAKAEFKEFNINDLELPSDGVKVLSVYTDNVEGFVVSVKCTEGYGGDVEVMVGVTEDLKVSKVKIMSMSETPGLGAKAQEPEFIDQFANLNGEIMVDKNGSAANAESKVEAISGATITSKAVTKAVNAALEVTEAIKTKWGNK
ncbi:MAG: RnfABCDGE type electron transport complex subunit G, partial [Oscillospiraceae bacterium]